MRRTLLVVAVVVIFILAGVGYWLFGTSTQIDRSEMSRLSVASTGLPSFEAKPYLHGPQQFASVPSKVLSEEAASEPAQTGVYAVGWKTASGKGNADLLIELLPTDATAESARQALQHEYATKKIYTSAGLKLLGTFPVPAVPGAFTASFSPTSSKNSSTVVDVVLFRVGRVAVSVVVQDQAHSGFNQQAASFAVAEKNVLERTEPRFSMSSQVHRPLTALWFGLVALGVSAAIVAAPRLLAYRRFRVEHRAERARRRELRHISARGGKVLKRRGAPAWQNHSRHRSRQRARR
jgi:hypothetical protein